MGGQVVFKKNPREAGTSDPDWTQTNDLLLRRQLLYSAELPDLFRSAKIIEKSFWVKENLDHSHTCSKKYQEGAFHLIFMVWPAFTSFWSCF